MLASLALAAALTINSADHWAAYVQCVRGSAAQLERSGETAPVVAEAAVRSCAERKMGAIADMMVIGQGRVSEEQTGRMLETDAQADAVLAVVQIRAARANPLSTGSRKRP